MREPWSTRQVGTCAEHVNAYGGTRKLPTAVVTQSFLQPTTVSILAEMTPIHDYLCSGRSRQYVATVVPYRVSKGLVSLLTLIRKFVNSFPSFKKQQLHVSLELHGMLGAACSNALIAGGASSKTESWMPNTSSQFSPLRSCRSEPDVSSVICPHLSSFGSPSAYVLLRKRGS
jgi:hypothetical protein